MATPTLPPVQPHEHRVSPDMEAQAAPVKPCPFNEAYYDSPEAQLTIFGPEYTDVSDESDDDPTPTPFAYKQPVAPTPAPFRYVQPAAVTNAGQSQPASAPAPVHFEEVVIGVKKEPHHPMTLRSYKPALRRSERIRSKPEAKRAKPSPFGPVSS